MRSLIEEATADAEPSRALGHRLRELRETAGYSQEKVAQAAGISRNHVQLIAAGLSDRRTRTPWNPHLSVLVAMCDALGVSVIDLFAGVGDVEFTPPPH